MRKEKGKIIEQIVRGISFFILMILVLLVMNKINKIQGTARVVNYTGIVRGAAQRIVKLEMAGMEDPELMNYMEEIIYELKNGGKKFNLTKLNDVLYQQKLDELILYWPFVKEEIELGKQIGWQNTNIIEVSEKFYRLTNLAARSAENYVQKSASHLQVLEIAVIIFMGFVGIGIIRQSYFAFNIIRENRALHQEAYQDPVSGIHNRSYFNHHMQKLMDQYINYTICYIDLDRLKYINDNFGHDKGDEYIRIFVRFIKNEIRENDMFCRIGGDEFTLVMVGSNEEAAIHKLENIRERFIVQKENRYHGSFSYGVVQINASNQFLPLDDILECADKRMYEYKVSHKAQR